MLFLTSDGFSSAALCAALPPMQGMRVALIPTAIASQKTRVPALDSLAQEMTALGAARCETMDIVSFTPKRLLRENFDALYLMGGNAFLLMKEIRARGHADALKWYAEERLILSSSGGSLVLGQTMAHIAMLDPSMNAKTKLTDLDGLGLIQTSICPHRTWFVQRYPRFLERIDAFERETGRRIVCLEDGQGVRGLGEEVWVIE